MKKGIVQNLVWIVATIILLLAGVYIFWLIASGQLSVGGDMLHNLIEKAGNMTQ